jgi:hypothetical protein
MKSTIKNLLLATAALLFTCSFTEITRLNTELTGLDAAPVGGAYVVFAGKYGGEITKKDLEGQTTLGVDGCARGSRIFQFTLHVRKNGKTATYSAKSNSLTREMISALSSLSDGDEFEFKNMKAYLPNGKDVVEVHGKAFKMVAQKA